MWTIFKYDRYQTGQFSAIMVFTAAFVSIAVSCMIYAYNSRTFIWFAPLDSIERPFNSTRGPSDFFALFQEDAHWPTTASHVDVFKIYPQLVTQASDSDLSKVFSDLARRHIALALEFGAMTDTAVCGHSVEGYDGEALFDIAKKIKGLGGNLAYLAMDEPLWYGVHYGGTNACRATIKAVAMDVARNINAVRAIFPSVKVGDIEPVGDVSGWPEEVMSWTKAYQTATGMNLAFFQADVMWNKPWRNPLKSLTNQLHAEGISVGVIYNGNGDDVSDIKWLAHAREHYLAVEANGQSPDQAVFQSWGNYPTHLLPESAPDSMTHLIEGYVIWHGGDQLRH